MEEMSESEKRNRAGVALTAATFLLLLYFLFPLLFALPVFMIYGHPINAPAPVQSAMDVAFFPVEYFYKRVPAYQWLLDEEKDLLGL